MLSDLTQNLQIRWIQIFPSITILLHMMDFRNVYLVSTNQGLGKRSPYLIHDTCAFLIVISWEAVWQVMQPW